MNRKWKTFPRSTSWAGGHDQLGNSFKLWSIVSFANGVKTNGDDARLISAQLASQPPQ
jgi:hypothetical protein